MWDSVSFLLTLLESFDKTNAEMGIDSVARQIHQETVQHYWVNIVCTVKKMWVGCEIPAKKWGDTEIA